MSQKSLVFIAFLFFVTGSAFLFWKNASEIGPSANQGWWSIAFSEPENRENLSFIIENRMGAAEFRYTIRTPDRMLSSGTVAVEQGERKTVDVAERAPESARPTVMVEQGNQKQEIYR